MYYAVIPCTLRKNVHGIFVKKIIEQKNENTENCAENSVI